VIIWFYSYVLILYLSTIYGTEWPIMCWCAVKKLLTLTHTHTLYSRMFWFGICYVLGCFQCFHDVIRTRVKYTLKSRWQLKWENWRSLILKDRCLFHLLLKQYAIKWCFIFSPHLASASALPGKTGNQEIASFHFNPQPADTQNTFKLSLGRMWITLCLQNNRTKQDLGWEHSMLSSVTTHSSFIMSVMIQ